MFFHQGAHFFVSFIRFLLGQVARTVQYRRMTGKISCNQFQSVGCGSKGGRKGGGGGGTGAGQPSHNMMTEILTVSSI